MRGWLNKVILKVLWQGWCSTCTLFARREALNSQNQKMLIAFDCQLALAGRAVGQTHNAKAKRVQADRRSFVAATVFDAATTARQGDWKTFSPKYVA